MALGRGIIWEPAATESADDAEARWERATDVIQIIEFALMRDPNVGKAISESGNYRVLTYEGAESIAHPTAVVTYEIQDHPLMGENIVVHEIAFYKAKHKKAGHA